MKGKFSQNPLADILLFLMGLSNADTSAVGIGLAPPSVEAESAAVVAAADILASKLISVGGGGGTM